MTDDDYEEYEYEYEYSDDESDNDEMCDRSQHSMMSVVKCDENANPNAPPSPPPEKSRHDARHAQQSTARPDIGSGRTTSAQDLVPLMNRRINDVTEALGVPTEAAAPLLRRFGWNTQRVLEAFMSDSERTLKQAGVTHRCSPVVVVAQTVQECSICMEDMMSADKCLSMPCGHAFCLECWQEYLTNTIQLEGATCMQATCPQASCHEILTHTEVQTAAPQLVEKYQHYLLKHFAEAVGRWCPGPGCDRVCVSNTNNSIEVADCDHCGTQFCTGCAEEPHAPVDCANLVKWQEKGADESETVNWLTVNTKNCPKCASRIEKNGGCMYVTCRKCHHGFCWVCMGTHHVWQCNAYKDPEEDGNQLRAKNELERYLHYYTRYQGHAQAQKFALKQLDKKGGKQAVSDGNKIGNVAAAATAALTGAAAGTAATTTQSTNNNDNNNTSKTTTNDAAKKAPENDDFDLPDYLKDANQQLVRCRRVLKYTYVFAYYHFVDPKRKVAKECFEFHQGTLEGLTEGLSKATEKPLPEIDQQDVVNRTRAIGEFIKNVLAHVDDGMDDEY